MTERDPDQLRQVYQPRRPVRCHWHEIRDVRYRVRTWGEPDGELVFLLHGWMDTGATFQFLVDCLDERRYVVAPDWRGFGDSGRARGESVRPWRA